MSIRTEISLGEFLDKMTILQIKRDRITESGKLANINRELEGLVLVWERSPYSEIDLRGELNLLREVNESLWDIENMIREKERKKEFDEEFIELARSVYLTNDRRADIKKAINRKLGSGIVEEKSYKPCAD